MWEMLQRKQMLRVLSNFNMNLIFNHSVKHVNVHFSPIEKYWNFVYWSGLIRPGNWVKYYVQDNNRISLNK